MKGLMTKLFLWDQDFFLQNVFMCLDTGSLRRCRQVNQELREFIDSRVWGCKKYKGIVTRRLWQDFYPIKKKLFVNGIVTSISCDDDTIACGYSNGDCEMFNAVTGDMIETFNGDLKDITYSSTKVHLGKNIVVKIAFGSSGRTGKCDIGIWNKATKKRIFTCLHKNTNLSVYLKVHKNTVFIREGKIFCKVAVVQSCDVKFGLLYKMDQMLKGDFLTNKKYIVSRCKNEISFSKLGSLSEVCKISTEKHILDLALRGHYVAILQEFSVSVLNLVTKEIQLKSQSSKQQISIACNSSIVAALDECNTVSIFNWTDLSERSQRMTPFTHTLQLTIPVSRRSYPSISLSETCIVVTESRNDSIIVYQLWNGSPEVF